MKISDLLEQKVSSSWIKDLTITGKNATMTLNNGKAYQILNILPDEFEWWLNSPSKGNYYNTEIKDEYVVKRIK